jgi:16S rRNA (cytidine1402-2'-O)-methyltransferase
MSQRQPDRGGTLFVVATPIGNLEDITLRALRVLKEVALVAAEDTRRTGNLLRHFEIQTPLLSLHEHNERQRAKAILERLGQGQSVALVTDAGTPGISDPGAELVRSVRDAGYPVTPVPGASAVSAALSVAGVSGEGFVFAGFPPSRSNDRKRWLSTVLTSRARAIVLFEAPHRVLRTLAEIGLRLGEQPILIGRELTKFHEEWLEGSADALMSKLETPKGEFVIVVPPATQATEAAVAPTDEEIGVLFGQIANTAGLLRRDALRETARQANIPVNHVYDALERLKKSGY